jgi:hypothetical protein
MERAARAAATVIEYLESRLLMAGAPAAVPAPVTRDGQYLYAVDLPWDHQGYADLPPQIEVFDINAGHAWVKNIPLLDGIYNVRGVAASVATGRMYIAFFNTPDESRYQPGGLLCLDMNTDQVVWERRYEQSMIPAPDRFAMTPDGSKIYMPVGEGSADSNYWVVLDAMTGDPLRRIYHVSAPHDTLVSLDGRYAFLEGQEFGAQPPEVLHTVAVVDTATDSVVRRIGPFRDVVRPFTINGGSTYLFATLNKFVGFEVGNVTTGEVVYTVPTPGVTHRPTTVGTECHGIALTPDETEIWLNDRVRGGIDVFDVSDLAKRAPRYVTFIPTRASGRDLAGNPDPAASNDTDNVPGWITTSIDGRFMYPEGGEIIDVATHQVVGQLRGRTTDAAGNGVVAPYTHSKNMIEVDFAGGRAVRVGDQYGVGRMAAPPSPVPDNWPIGSVGDIVVGEPASGTRPALLTIVLDRAPTAEVRLGYATADGTAIAGQDYGAAQGTLVFAPGETTKTVSVSVPADADDPAGESFSLKLTPVGDADVLLPDDVAVITISAPPVAVLPVDARARATFDVPGGGRAIVTLRGPGSAEVEVLPDGTARLTATGTTGASVIQVGGSAVTFSAVEVNGSLKSFTAKSADVTGPFAVAGSLARLQLRDASRAAVVIGPGSPASVILRTATDVNVVSDAPITSMRVAAWLDTDAVRDGVTAPFVGTLSSAGDFAADVAADEIASVLVGGTLDGVDVRAMHRVGGVRAGAIRDSRIFAGVRPGVAALPGTADDFTNPAASVGRVSTRAFAGSLIAAPEVGRLTLGDVMPAAAGTSFGLATDRLASLAGSVTTRRLKLGGLSESSQSLSYDDFIVRIL